MRRAVLLLTPLPLTAAILLAPGAFAAPPGPGQHFDCSDGGSGISCASDDVGCVSQTKDDPSNPTVNTAKCGDGLAKAFGKAIAAVGKCHKAQIVAAFKGAPADDETCETTGPKSAKAKLDAAIAKLTPVCTATQLANATTEENLLFAGKSTVGSLDNINGSVYCAGTVDVDASGDDAGKVPPDKGNLSCEESLSGSLSKLVGAIIKCHVKMNDALFSGKDFDENACEELDAVKHKSAIEKFNAAMDKLDSKGTCTDGCMSRTNRNSIRDQVKALVEAANGLVYPCSVTTTTTTTSSTTTTLCSGGCCCGSSLPTALSFTTAVGAGTCGQLENTAGGIFSNLACGGIYFGGAGIGVSLPVTIPDQGVSRLNASCSGTTLTLTGTTPAQAGSNRCVRGPNRGSACLTDANCGACSSSANCHGGICSGSVCTGACAQLTCTDAGCLFGAPAPFPNGGHNGAATSTCYVNRIAQNAAGTADCLTGATTGLSMSIGSEVFLTGDLMSMRCSGGSTPGAPCAAGGGCGTVAAGSCPGGTCVNDFGRCRSGGGQAADTPCCVDTDCTLSNTCENGTCVGGGNANFGCISASDCPGGTCRSLLQPCPICDSNTSKCDGGDANGLACLPGTGNLGGSYPTSHDCPPPAAASIGSMPNAFVLESGTKTATAVDLPNQTNVFCGFCRSNSILTFPRRCDGLASGASCTCAPGVSCATCGGGSHVCAAVACTSNADCSAISNTSCQQHTPGAFTSVDVARTIVAVGQNAAGYLFTGGPPRSSTLVSTYCVPPFFNSLVDNTYDLPGPGMVSLPGQVQLLP